MYLLKYKISLDLGVLAWLSECHKMDNFLPLLNVQVSFTMSSLCLVEDFKSLNGLSWDASQQQQCIAWSTSNNQVKKMFGQKTLQVTFFW